MEIRITAKQEEAQATAETLEDVFEIENISRFYPNRGNTKLGRIYIKCNSSNTVHKKTMER